MKIKMKLWWDLDSVLWHKKYSIRTLRLAEDRDKHLILDKKLYLASTHDV